MYSAIGSYDHKSQFKTEQKSPNAGFGSESKRFGNLGVGHSDVRNWSPYGPSYYGTNTIGTLGRSEPGSQAYRDLKNKTTAHTFGVGRDNMKKLYIEEIMLNRNNTGMNPGAGTYEATPGFGA